MYNYFFYIFQSYFYSKFFIDYIQPEKKIKPFLIIFLFFLVIIYPLALLLLKNYGLKLSLFFILIFLLLCLLFRKEKKSKLLMATLLYQLGVFLCDFVFILMLLCLANNDGEDYWLSIRSYSILFPITQCLIVYIIFKIELNYFKETYSFAKKRSFILASLCWIFQCFCLMSSNFMHSNKLFLFYFISLFSISIGINIVLFHHLFEEFNKEKLAKSIVYLEDSYKQYLFAYPKLANKQTFRKLRHDYINFIESKENPS